MTHVGFIVAVRGTGSAAGGDSFLRCITGGDRVLYEWAGRPARARTMGHSVYGYQYTAHVAVAARSLYSDRRRFVDPAPGEALREADDRDRARPACGVA